MNTIHSYPKIWSFSSHIPLSPWDGKPAIIQEKVDGSQLSFAKLNGELHMRSKGQPIYGQGENKMFQPAWDAVQERLPWLPEGVVFRGEYLSKPKHNVLAYDRVPTNNIVLFDAEDDKQGRWGFWSAGELMRIAGLMGFEVVPLLDDVVITSADALRSYLDTQSFLGGQTIEGVVLKRYDLLVPQFQSPLFCKYVSEKFKETKAYVDKAGTRADVYEKIAARYRTPARWEKAVIHLRERGELEDSPRDIGNLIREVQTDIRDECGDEIAQHLANHWWSSSGKTLTRGLPEWYKDRLLDESFEVAA